MTEYSGSVPSGCQSLGNNQLGCGRVSILIDGNTGPTTDSVDLTSASAMNDFLKLHNMSIIFFSFESSFTFESIAVLHFLNYPDENIGLPNFQLSTGAKTVDFSISGQNELSTDDRRVRSVTLNVQSLGTTSGTEVGVDVSFNGLSNIEQFYLSEVSFFELREPITFQYPPSDNTVVNPFPHTPSSIVLNCTVNEMGTFEWRWKKGEQVISDIQLGIAQSTRESRHTISPASVF